MNFLLTNRIPRRLATRAVGRIARIENRLVCRACVALWRLFTPLDLSDAAETEFRSLRAVFTRRLRPGARPFDPDPAALASPCDAIVGACGRVEDGLVLQVKGMPYAVEELLLDRDAAAPFRDGSYATLRLTSAMYHRFHAPHDLRVEEVTHVPGDCWNVNPPALARVPRLYCRNERAVLRARLAGDGPGAGAPIAIVPVAAILVAGIRLAFAELPRGGEPSRRAVDVAASRGEELGWFEHGSTIVLLAPAGARLADGIAPGRVLRAGEALMRFDPAGRDGLSDR